MKRIALLLLLTVAVLTAAPAFTVCSDGTLFVIERSKNANIVVYEANLDKKGALARRDPVKAYWVLHADGGQRKDLNLVERTMAYGFDIERVKGEDACLMYLKPFKERAIRVDMENGCPEATMSISGRDARVTKFFIKSLEGNKVEYVDLHGVSLEDGQEVTERINPTN